MSIYRLKPAFQSLLRPLVRALARAGIRANQVTLAACLVSIGVVALLVLHPGQATLFVLVPTWMLLRMAMNAIDGSWRASSPRRRRWVRTSTRFPMSSPMQPFICRLD